MPTTNARKPKKGRKIVEPSEKRDCPGCNGSGEACCEDWIWIANQVSWRPDTPTISHLQFIMEHDGAGQRVGMMGDDGLTLFFTYCPFCGKKSA